MQASQSSWFSAIFELTSLIKRLFTLFIALLSAISSAVYALDEMVITSQTLEETIPLKLEKYGNQVEIITAEELAEYDFVDVADALRALVPGLYISPKNGPFDYLKASLQGSRNVDILWLVDGVRITNRLYNGTSPLDTIPPHIVERIEVLKGGQGIFYGTQSVAGVINIVTKSFSKEAGGEVSVGGHTNDGYHVNGFLRGSIGAHSFVAYASKDDADGYEPYDDNEVQDSATDLERSYKVETGGLKYAWDISRNTRISAQYQVTNNEVDFLRPFLNNKSINDRKEELATIKLDSKINDSVVLFVKAYRHTWDTKYTRIYNELDDNGELTGDTVVLNDQSYWGYEDYGFNAMAEIALGDLFTYVVGFDQQKFSAEDEVWRIGNQKERVNAAFMQVRSNEALLENTLIAIGARNNRPSEADSSTVWNINAKHFFNKQWYVQGNIGTSFRLPDAEALFLNEYYDADNDGVPDGGWFAIGNPELKPEKSKNYNLSVGAAFNRGAFELTAFKRDIEDYIDSYVPLTIEGVVGESFENSDDEVNIEGGELAHSYQLVAGLSSRFSYTYTRARFNDEGEQLNDIPKDLAKLGLDYAGDDMPWGGSLTAVYVGNVNDRIRRDDYITADLSGFFDFGADSEHRVTLRLENIGDVVYATSTGNATADESGESYVYRSLGVGRTTHLSYRYQF